MSIVLPRKRVFIWAEKSVFYRKKGVHFELKSLCFIAKKGLFWAQKSVFYHKKGGHFQTGKQGWVPRFPLSEGAGDHCGMLGRKWGVTWSSWHAWKMRKRHTSMCSMFEDKAWSPNTSRCFGHVCLEDCRPDREVIRSCVRHLMSCRMTGMLDLHTERQDIVMTA